MKADMIKYDKGTDFLITNVKENLFQHHLLSVRWNMKVHKFNASNIF